MNLYDHFSNLYNRSSVEITLSKIGGTGVMYVINELNKRKNIVQFINGIRNGPFIRLNYINLLSINSMDLVIR